MVILICISLMSKDIDHFLYNYSGNQFGHFSKKFENSSTSRTAIPFMGIYLIMVHHPTSVIAELCSEQLY
jgi:hypothetical protein